MQPKWQPEMQPTLRLDNIMPTAWPLALHSCFGSLNSTSALKSCFSFLKWFLTTYLGFHKVTTTNTSVDLHIHANKNKIIWEIEKYKLRTHTSFSVGDVKNGHKGINSKHQDSFKDTEDQLSLMSEKRPLIHREGIQFERDRVSQDFTSLSRKFLELPLQTLP